MLKSRHVFQCVDCESWVLHGWYRCPYCWCEFVWEVADNMVGALLAKASGRPESEASVFASSGTPTRGASTAASSGASVPALAAAVGGPPPVVSTASSSSTDPRPPTLAQAMMLPEMSELPAVSKALTTRDPKAFYALRIAAYRGCTYRHPTVAQKTWETAHMRLVSKCFDHRRKWEQNTPSPTPGTPPWRDRLANMGYSWFLSGPKLHIHWNDSVGIDKLPQDHGWKPSGEDVLMLFSCDGMNDVTGVHPRTRRARHCLSNAASRCTTSTSSPVFCNG